MRIIFFGTPETAVPYLEFLFGRTQVVAAVTRADRAANRGQEIQKSPVKIFAEKKSMPVLQPVLLKDTDFISKITELKPEAGIVVAYGKILPKELIGLFPKGIFNIHFSLLPSLRGAAPIQWSILRGERKTGVTLFRITESLDSGGIIHQKEVAITPQDDSISLEKKLIPAGLSILEESLPQIDGTQAKENPQTGDSSYAPLIKKEDAKIHWEKSAEEIHRQIRALIRTGAYCRLPNGKTLKIFQAEPRGSSLEFSEKFKPGAIIEVVPGQGFLVKCGLGNLLVLKTQLEGKKTAEAWSFLQGHPLKAGDKFLEG